MLKHSTLELYGVQPEHFDNMLRWDSIKEMILLSEKRMKEIHDEASDLVFGCEEYEYLYSIYRTTDKAKKFNEDLLQERLRRGKLNT